MGHQPSFACEDCGVDVPVVHPGRARSVVCSACGAQHDLFAAGAPVIDHVPLKLHRPEGLLELGSKGTFGRRVIQVIGRLRLSSMTAGRVRMWDEWILITADGKYLRIRESEGNYEILIPFDPDPPLDGQFVDRTRQVPAVHFGGHAAKVLASLSAKVLYVEGELTSRICMGDIVDVVELDAHREGTVVIESTYDDNWCFSVEPVEDRAMWALFGYDGILDAHDRLWHARARNQFLARGVAQAAAVLLTGAALGGFLLVGVLTAHTSVAEGWARFDFGVRDVVVEEVTGTVPMRTQWGYYTMDVDCSLDSGSEGIELLAEAPSGRTYTLVRCVHESSGPANRFASHSFRVQEDGPWRLTAVHRASPGQDGRASLSWQLSWDLGSTSWPLGGLFTLMALGLASLILYPVARIIGLGALERAYEDRRAELALHLRKRFHDSQEEDAEKQPAPGDGDAPNGELL